MSAAPAAPVAVVGPHADPASLVSANARRLYNSAVVTYAVSAAMELGLLDALDRRGSVDLDEFAAEHAVDRQIVLAIADVLAAGDIITFQRGACRVSCGPEFDGVLHASPFFYWLTRGSGRLLSQLPDHAHGRTPATQPDEDPWGRDMRAVAIASSTAAGLYFDDMLAGVLATVDYGVVADLGCGGGARLRTLLGRRQGTRGIGIDVSAAALDLARENVMVEGLGDRVDFVRHDVTDLQPRPEFADVDLLTCFLMGHDFWPRASAVRTMRSLRTAFPRVREFILCDECQVHTPLTMESTIFTMGFMLAHAGMGKYVPSVEEWHGVFADSGWRCVEVVRTGVPESNVVFRLRPAD